MSKNFHSLIILSLILTSGFMKSMEEQTTISSNQDAQQFQAFELNSDVGPIKEIKYNATGDKIAIIGKNCNFAEIWNISTHKLICQLKHKATIICIDWHPNAGFENTVITGSKDQDIKLWDISKKLCVTNHCSSAIEAIAFANTNPIMFVSGHSSTLPCIRFFKDCSTATFVNRLDFTGKVAPVYHASFPQSGKFVCIATTDGTVKIFEQSEEFNQQYPTGSWTPKLVHNLLLSNDKLESCSIISNQIVLRMKDMKTGVQNCDIFDLENGIEIETDFQIFDCCEKTQHSLGTLWYCDEKLFEFSSDLSLTNKEKLIFEFTSPIKSATYNTSGNQILVITEQDSHILENKDDQWSCIYSESTQSKILLHPHRHDLFISIPQACNNNIICVWKAYDSAEIVNTEVRPEENRAITATSKEVIDPMEQDEIEQLMLLKRKRNSFEKAKNASATKRNKIFSNSDEDNLDDVSTEMYEGLSEEDNNNSSNRIRRESEIQMLLNMHELVTIDQQILNKSLIEVVATHKDEVIQKYLNCIVNCDLNKQDDKGRTALFIATDNNKESIVKLLIERGANINIANHQGLSPLHVAVKKGYLAIAKYLIAQQALINKQTTEGETALHFAIKTMDLDAVKIILASDDVDLKLLDKDFNSPLSLIIANRNPDLIELFGEKLNSIKKLNKFKKF